jgi:hypothetical protein
MQCQHRFSSAAKNQCQNKTADPSGLCHKHVNARQGNSAASNWNPAPVLPGQTTSRTAGKAPTRYEPVPPQNDSLLSVMNPFNSKRRKLKDTAKSILEQDIADRQRNNDAGNDQALYASIEDVIISPHTVEPPQHTVMQSLGMASNRTLELIDREFGGGNSQGALSYLARYADTSGATVREALHFRKELGDTTDAVRLLDDVRVSRSEFMREDLSELTGESLDRATVLLSLARDVYEESLNRGVDVVTVGTPVAVIEGRPTSPAFKISQPLIDVVFEYPDRVQDIASYIKTRIAAPQHITPESLREYLATNSRSLSSGVL